MESDTDSEADRRAYSLYPSLAFEGDEDIDDEAAAYLRAVRTEAQALPDVMTASCEPEEQELTVGAADREEAQTQEKDGLPRGASIAASPSWVKLFMANFLKLRLRLQSLELAEPSSNGHGSDDASSGPGYQDHAGNGARSCPESLSSVPGLSEVLRLGPVGISNALDEEIDRLVHATPATAKETYRIYCLAAALDYPLMADTEASLQQLLRHCSNVRLKAGRDINQPLAACLDILQVISGAYFGQDERLRSQYRQHGVHV